MEKIIRILLCCSVAARAVRARSVLDPAVYLAPSPPLAPAPGDLSPQQLWALEPRIGLAEEERQLRVLPLKKDVKLAVTKLGDISPQELWAMEPRLGLEEEKMQETRAQALNEKAEKESMEGSETFWSGYRPSGQAAYVVPVSYGYGGYGAGTSYGGGVGGSYTSPGLSSGLAGAGYGTYGSGTGVAWSGWGNGQWGHYGSG